MYNLSNKISSVLSIENPQTKLLDYFITWNSQRVKININGELKDYGKNQQVLQYSTPNFDLSGVYYV